jgi:hypothetical protein
MKLTIIKEFHDIEDFSHVFQVGDVVEFKDDRAKEIISLGLGEELYQEGEELHQEGEELHQEGEELHQEERKSSIEVSGKGGKRLTNIED